MANFLVTGGTGQIGAYVSKELVNSGQGLVIYDFKPNVENVADIANKVAIVPGDVLDQNELLNTIKNNRITHIIHLAAFLVLESKNRPAKAIEVNCVGTSNVFEAARIFDIQRIVFASSVTVYGSPKLYRRAIVDEDDFPHCPSDPYSITKFVNEAMGKFYRETYGLDVVCLRVAGAWGPGRYSGYTGQFNDFMKNTAIGKPAKFPEDFAYKNANLRWLHVKDMASCFLHAALVDKNRIRRALYNAGSREAFKALDVVNALRGLLPSQRIDFSEVNEPTTISSDVPGASGLDVDCRRLYEELGFEAKLGLKEAVKDTVEFERAKVGLTAIQPDEISL